MKRLLGFVLVVALVVLSLPVVAQETTLRWRTRPDNQAEIDVYTGRQ